MNATQSPPKSTPEACIDEALAIIDQDGLEQLSLREVARRLGISHQAPYKHFPSRDHLLAAVVARAFSAFAAHLDARPRPADPAEDLAGMGRAYVEYALKHPLQYRLMFGTPLPDPEDHPEMMAQARHAFGLLQLGLAERARAAGAAVAEQEIHLDALFIWSCLHGLAGILKSSTLDTLPIPSSLLVKLPGHVLGRIGDALGPLKQAKGSKK